MSDWNNVYKLLWVFFTESDVVCRQVPATSTDSPSPPTQEENGGDDETVSCPQSPTFYISLPSPNCAMKSLTLVIQLGAHWNYRTEHHDIQLADLLQATVMSHELQT